jgi:hypothetical protein
MSAGTKTRKCEFLLRAKVRVEVNESEEKMRTTEEESGRMVFVIANRSLWNVWVQLVVESVLSLAIAS